MGIRRESSARRILRRWLVEKKSGIARGGSGNEVLHHLLKVTTLNWVPENVNLCLVIEPMFPLRRAENPGILRTDIQARVISTL